MPRIVADMTWRSVLIERREDKFAHRSCGCLYGCVHSLKAYVTWGETHVRVGLVQKKGREYTCGELHAPFECLDRERPLSAETFVLVANQLRLSVLANQLMKGKANGDDACTRYACTRSLRANCSDRLSHAQIAVPSALAAQLPAFELAS
jgi:hypothetical protein